MRKQTSFTDIKMRYGNTRDEQDKLPGWAQHSVDWKNMRPICPYGCGEEGTLLEVVMQEGKAIGIYTHSESVKPFTADLQMSPKPTGRKIVIGPDGEPQLVSEEDTS